MTTAGQPDRHEQAGNARYSIGSVLAQLRAEFPDVTISKIRFLESEGLVQPERTTSGYRQFGVSDVQRLRFVLEAQRDHYLPLRVIKERLEEMDRGLRSVDAIGAGSSREAGTSTDAVGRALVSEGERLPSGADFHPDRELRLTREDLLEQADIAENLLRELERYRLIVAGTAGFYRSDDVVVAATARTMAGYGIEPRHLGSFRSSAEREVGLLRQVMAPVSGKADATAIGRAEETARELAALSVRLHATLVKIGVRDALEG